MSETKKITILIVDDHELFRKALLCILEDKPIYSVIGEASDGNEAVERALKLKPDIIFMDILMPRLDGIAAAQRIRRKLPDAKIVFLTAIGHKENIFQAMRMGAVGYLEKTIGVKAFFSAMDSILSGDDFICPTLKEEEINSLTQRLKEGEREFGRLSSREREILKLTCDGYTSKMIARLLNISSKTADNHKANIMAKLGINKRALLVKYALRKGMIDLKLN